MTQRWGDTLYPADAVVSARRGLRRPARLGHRALSRPVGVLQQLRPLRRAHRRARPAGSSSGTGVLQNPEEVLTPNARERLTHVLESDAMTHDRRRRRSRAGPGARRAGRPRSSGTSSPTPSTTSPGRRRRSSCWTATRATIPGKGPVPINMVYLPGRRAALRERRADRAPRARVLLEAVVRRTRSRSSRCRTGRAPAWSTRW